MSEDCSREREELRQEIVQFIQTKLHERGFVEEAGGYEIAPASAHDLLMEAISMVLAEELGGATNVERNQLYFVGVVVHSGERAPCTQYGPVVIKTVMPETSELPETQIN